MFLRGYETISNYLEPYILDNTSFYYKMNNGTYFHPNFSKYMTKYKNVTMSIMDIY